MDRSTVVACASCGGSDRVGDGSGAIGGGVGYSSGHDLQLDFPGVAETCSVGERSSEVCDEGCVGVDVASSGEPGLTERDPCSKLPLRG